MSGEAKTVTVKVIYKPNQTPNVELVSDLMENGLLTFRNDRHDGFWVHFVLDNVSLVDYRFVNTGRSPMYSAVSTDGTIPCPTSGTWPKFRVHDVQERVLVVRNKNRLEAGRYEERFGFTLRVTKDAGDSGKVISLDPGGVNQNGPTQPFSKAALLITGGVVGAVLALGAEALLFN